MKVGMAYDVGGRGDQSFNDAAAAGLDKAKAELGADIKEATATSNEPESAREERLQQLIDAGYTTVVAVGFAYAKSVKKVAAANPEAKFALIDSTDAAGPNIESLTFAEQEGSFLVGAAAALKSKTGNVGFIGGVNVDLIKKFEAGYVMGAKAVNPAIKIQVKYLTQPPRACSSRVLTWSTTPLVARVAVCSPRPRPRARWRSVSTPTRRSPRRPPSRASSSPR